MSGSPRVHPFGFQGSAVVNPTISRNPSLSKSAATAFLMATRDNLLERLLRSVKVPSPFDIKNTGGVFTIGYSSMTSSRPSLLKSAINLISTAAISDSKCERRLPSESLAYLDGLVLIWGKKVENKSNCRCW